MKILVVEDEVRVAEYIKKGLEMKTMVVDTATDGETGLGMALDQSYELIILDRMLPKLDGLALCRELRQNRIETPILMLTAKTTIEDRVEGLEGGADDYLGKPFAFSELLARVKALSRRSQLTQSEKLTADNLILDTQKMAVTRSDRKITLTKKEYQLLEYLLRHQGRVMSAEKLTQAVWPYDSEVLPNTAQVYIGYLRKKVDRAFPGEPPMIKTERGFGYKLEV